MRVLDAKGYELRLPAQVERFWLPEKHGFCRHGGMRGIVTHVGKQVDVTWVTKSGAAFSTFDTERVGWFPHTRQCLWLAVCPSAVLDCAT